MSAQAFSTFLKRAAGLLACGLLLALSGCAHNYVVLLPDGDGSLGKVQVSGPNGITLLDQKSQGTVIGDTEKRTFIVSDDKVREDFGAALAASPGKPARYVLYFDAGHAVLTAASQADIEKIRADIRSRAGADMSVIGHTDTQGDAQANYELGLARAKAVAELIGSTELSSERLSIESHGEKTLLIATPDDTDEPRNRRVEVIVR